jgi:hypothetical protein
MLHVKLGNVTEFQIYGRYAGKVYTEGGYLWAEAASKTEPRIFGTRQLAINWIEKVES